MVSIGVLEEMSGVIKTVNIYEPIGKTAYEAAAKVTDCKQSWEDANQEKWIAAALAVQADERQRCIDAGNTIIKTDDECVTPQERVEAEIFNRAIQAYQKVLENEYT